MSGEASSRVPGVPAPVDSEAVRIVPFAPEYAAAFKALNLAWITEHWEPEPSDSASLDQPQHYIIGRGGHITLAMLGDRIVGTCALIPMDDGGCELAKMSVAASARGKGIGRLLGETVIEKARKLGAPRVYLESNTVLAPAIALYRKLGFRPVDGSPSPYQRCNIQMELRLD